MFVVFANSQKMNFGIADFPTYEEAENFCDDLNWVYVDQNDFVWDLDILEIEE